jgi:hypothetical protein
MESGTLFAKGFEYVQNGFLFQSSQTAGSLDADTFTQQPDNVGDFAGFDSQTVERLRLAKRFATTLATETTDDTVSVTEFGEVFGFAGAT